MNQPIILTLLLVPSLAIAGHWAAGKTELLSSCYLFPAAQEKLIATKDGKTFRYLYTYRTKERVRVFVPDKGLLLHDDFERLVNHSREFTATNKYPILEQVAVFVGSYASQVCE